MTGKLHTGYPYCMIELNLVRKVYEYEVAVGNQFTWQESSINSRRPWNAIVVGLNARKEQTYACRVKQSKNLIPGRVR